MAISGDSYYGSYDENEWADHRKGAGKYKYKAGLHKTEFRAKPQVSDKHHCETASGQDIGKARLGNLASFQGCLYGGVVLTATLTLFTVRPDGTAVHPRCKW